MTLDYSLLGEREASAAKERTHRRSIDYIRLAGCQRQSGMTRSEYWQRTADSANVEQIICAVGLTRKNGPLVGKWLNRRRLREDIQDAFDTYKLHQLADDKVLGKLRRERLTQIEKLSSQILHVLSPTQSPVRDGERGKDASTIALGLLAPYFPAYEGQFFESPQVDNIPENERGTASLTGLIAALTRLERAARELKDEKDTESDALVIASGAIARQPQNAADALVGRYLARVYEKWFHHSAGGGRPSTGAGRESSASANGPYIRFVIAVLADWENQGLQAPTYTADSIAKMLERSRKGVSRRGTKPSPKRRLIKARYT